MFWKGLKKRVKGAFKKVDYRRGKRLQELRNESQFNQLNRKKKLEKMERFFARENVPISEGDLSVLRSLSNEALFKIEKFGLNSYRIDPKTAQWAVEACLRFFQRKRIGEMPEPFSLPANKKRQTEKGVPITIVSATKEDKKLAAFIQDYIRKKEALGG